MQSIDISTVAILIASFSILNLGVGYVLGHFGISSIATDLSEVKGLISGQNKITVVPSSVASNVAPTPVVVPVNSPAA